MAKSGSSQNCLSGKLIGGYHSGVAHITGMVAHFTGIQPTKRDDENETMETR